jgi:hypothetical protein
MRSMDLTRLLPLNPVVLAHTDNLHGPGDAIIADEALEERAIEHADQFLGRLTTLCDKHGLPRGVDSFRFLLDIYAGIAHVELVQRTLDEHKARRSETLLTLESAFPILPGARPQAVCTRFQSHWMDVDQIVIEGTPEHWRIHDLKIGSLSQLGRSTSVGIGGEMFRRGGLLSQIKLRRLHMCMDLQMEVEYVGPRAEGERFLATVSGMAESSH